MLFEILRQPQLALAAHKKPRTDNIVCDQIPITAQSSFGNWIMNVLGVKESHWDERWIGFPARVLFDCGQQVLLELDNRFRRALCLFLISERLQNGHDIAQRAPTSGLGVKRIHRHFDVRAIILLWQQPVFTGAPVEQ